MRTRAILLFAAAVLGLAGALLPALASGDSSTGASATFSAKDFAWQAAGGGSRVNVPTGGTVTFGYPSGFSDHNADFSGGPSPSSCTQAAGPSSGSVPPLPHQPTGPGWSGSCTFNTPGTYTFHCDLHPFMTGTIVVGSSTTTTTTTTTTTSAPPPVHATVHIAATQHGTVVRGRVALAGSASGRVDVALLAARRLFGRGRGSTAVGEARPRLPASGRLTFAVRLDRMARAYLRRHRRLHVTVRLTLLAPGQRARQLAARQVNLRR